MPDASAAQIPTSYFHVERARWELAGLTHLAKHLLQLPLVVRRADAPTHEEHHATKVVELQDTIMVAIKAREEEDQLLERPVIEAIEDVMIHRRARTMEAHVEIVPLPQHERPGQGVNVISVISGSGRSKWK